MIQIFLQVLSGFLFGWFLGRWEQRKRAGELVKWMDKHRDACPECSGRGLIEFPWCIGGGEVECPKCCGTGRHHVRAE